MHEMLTIAINDPVACLSVCLSVCHAASLCKTAVRIEVLFEVNNLGNPRNITRFPHCFDGALAKLLWPRVD